jgi:sirohydrochlorin cobaltochelatase
MSEKLGVMLCGHGSRDKDAVKEFAVLAEHLKKRLPQYPVEFGYLEFATPIIRDGLDKLRASGVTRVLAVPGMLFAAGHAKNDIPSVLNTYAAQATPALEITYGKELGIDPKMLRAAGDRIQQAFDIFRLVIMSRHETLLVVVGRGASDPDANSNVSKVMRMLWEGLGFGWGESRLFGRHLPAGGTGARPRVRLGFKRIVVFPYFLFTGILVDRIYDATDAVAARHPGYRVHQGALPQRPSRRDRHLPRPRCRKMLVRRHRHELPAVQVPHAGAGLRGRSGRWCRRATTTMSKASAQAMTARIAMADPAPMPARRPPAAHLN